MRKAFLSIILVLLALSIILLYKTFLITDRPNIILISIDTLRQDHVGVYGYERNTTPVLDKIASEGVVFKNSYSTAPWTLPSHMSMFTGLPPSVHMVDIDDRSLDSKKDILTEILNSSGYVTGGFFSAIYLKGEYGFSRGFDLYSNEIKKDSDTITDKALEWIEERKQSEFFLFLHYFDVHWPYRPPVKYAEKFGVDTSQKRWFRYGKLMFLRNFTDPSVKMGEKTRKKVIDLYDAEIYRIDASIGRLIAYLKEKKLYDKTIIMVTSDHGEEFKEHGSFGHFHQLYSELINVPLIIRFPKIIPGGVVSEIPVSSVDISSILLDMASIDIPSQFKEYGKSIDEMINKDAENKGLQTRQIISETRKGSTHHFAYIKKSHKYISPYMFQPLIKKKKWVRIDDKLFNFRSDISDSFNLLKSELDIGKYREISDPLKKEIEEYTKANIPGIRIVFFPSSDVGANLISGSIDNGSHSEELPFGLNFDRNDRITDDKLSQTIKFDLHIKNKKKEIVFHLNKKLETLSQFKIKISSVENSIFEGEINITKLVKPLTLYKGSLGSIFILKSGNLSNVTYTNLSEREKNTLKTLGYIN